MTIGTLTVDEVLTGRPLGRTGLSAPKLAIGTSALGSIPRIYGYEVDAAQAATTLRAVLTGPIRFVDTSNSYGAGESERRIGAALRELGGLPDDLLLTTKVDPDASGDFSGARVRRSLDESSERLGLTTFPLVFLHDPERIGFEDAMGPGGPVEALIALQDEGRIGHLGVAGGPIGLLREFVATGVFSAALSHNRWTLLDRSAGPLFDDCAERGIAVLNAAPFGGGLLVKGPEAAPKYAYRDVPDGLRDSAIAMGRACERAGVPLAAAAIAVLLARPADQQHGDRHHAAGALGRNIGFGNECRTRLAVGGTAGILPAAVGLARMTPPAPRLRWALVGTGNVAARFGIDLRLSEQHELVAVHSRSPERGQAFAARVRAPAWHTDLTSMLAREDVDAVYIAVPHPLHHRLAAAAIDAGKAVLLEKPFTVTAAEARDLVERARVRRVFLMEAMWTRFLPHMVQVRRLLEDGRLGDIRAVTAEHGVWFEHNPTHRMFDPALGGGALLDLAVYPISFASMVLGSPTSVTATATFTDTGVDAQTVVVLDHHGGRRAVTTSSMEAWLSNRALIAGDAARLEIDRSWLHPSSFTVTDRDGRAERHEFAVEGTGYRFQADEVARGVREGRSGSDVMSLEETCAVMETLDIARQQIGLRHPGESVLA